MGFRFRRTISIIPGVRLNLSNSSPSLSIGPRGASITVGRRGTYANLGLPGTGLSYRTRLDQAASNTGNAARVRAESKEQLRNELLASIEQMEGVMTQVINVHTLTPNPSQGHTMSELQAHYLKQATQPYAIEAPIRPSKPITPPVPEHPDPNEGAGFLKKLFESEEDRQERQTTAIQNWRRAVQDWERENALTEQRYQSQRAAWAEQYANWQYEAKCHQEAIDASTANVVYRFTNDASYFESLLDEVLQLTDWPRETQVSFEVIPSESLIHLDVDLPEIEDMPQSSFSLNRSKTEIIEKPMTQKAVRENYARHVHGCLFRLIGLSLFALPFDTVMVSGFTQRISKETGNLTDDYILSCRVKRSELMRVNFNRLGDVDPVEALAMFDLNRKMTSTHILQTIELNGC